MLDSEEKSYKVPKTRKVRYTSSAETHQTLFSISLKLRVKQHLIGILIVECTHQIRKSKIFLQTSIDEPKQNIFYFNCFHSKNLLYLLTEKKPMIFNFVNKFFKQRQSETKIVLHEESFGTTKTKNSFFQNSKLENVSQYRFLFHLIENRQIFLFFYNVYVVSTRVSSCWQK